MIPSDSRHKVLVVDDETIVALDFVLLLQRLGTQPAGPAQTLEAAREILLAEPVDAALLNVRVGNQLVYPLADDLRQQGTPFAFITGDGPEHLPLRFRYSTCFRKPISDSTIKDWVERLPPALARIPLRRQWPRRRPVL